MPLPSGTRLGPYEIRACLEVAGLGQAYAVRDHERQRDAAMRVLPADFGAEPGLLQRFERDAEAVALLAHENILATYNLGTDARAVYVITEPVNGRTLRDTLAAGAPSPRMAARMGSQIARALAAAHERGVVHRDLKPENILIGPEGRVLVAGFGLAAITQVESAFAGFKGGAPGATLGSPAYMSPEQVKGEPTGPPADVFTLGAILHEVFTGARAFCGDTPLATLTAVVKARPTIPRSVRLPPAVARTIASCLEKQPRERPAAAAVARTLDDLWHEEIVSAQLRR